MSEESKLDKEFDEFADSPLETNDELPEIEGPTDEPTAPVAKPRRKRLAKKLQGDGSVSRLKKQINSPAVMYPFSEVWAKRIEDLETEIERLKAASRKSFKQKSGVKVKRTRKKKVIRRKRKKVGAFAKRWKAITSFFKRK